MLMGICSPFIFLIIWLFCQVGRFNHLIEVYTHKANIGFTLKAAIDHIHNIEGDDNNKSTTLTTLHELLNKLYESPISTKDKPFTNHRTTQRSKRTCKYDKTDIRQNKHLITN